MSRLILFLFLLILLIFVLSFSVINSHDVVVNYYVGSQQIPLALLLVVTVSVGALLGLVATMRVIMGLRLQVAKLKRNVRVTEQELENLRSLPVKEP